MSQFPKVEDLLDIKLNHRLVQASIVQSLSCGALMFEMGWLR
jgi:hypothetical protein